MQECHQLTTTNGKVEMFYRGQAPWHRLGTKVEGVPTIAEAIAAAGMGWNVELQSLFTMTDGKIGDEAKQMATVRTDINKILGIVSAKYPILQNSEAFDFFQPMVDAGLVTLETAGSLDGGKRIWVLAKTVSQTTDIVKGDPIEQYWLLSNSHTGKFSIRVGTTPIRVVCNNTLTAAMSGSTSKLIRVRHSDNMKDSLKLVQEIANVANSEFAATAEQYRAMAKTAINQKDAEKYVRIIFNLKEKEDESRQSKVVEQVLNLAETGLGTDIAGVRGSMWGLYNAVTEYIQYDRGRNEEKRLDSAWFGPGAAFNKKAFDTALEMVKVAA